MKTTNVFLMTSLMLCVIFSANAQSRNDAFWVIEGNPSLQGYTMIRFYSADRRLLGEERVDKKWINLNRSRNIRRLDKKLRQRLEADSLAKMAGLKRRN